MSEFSGPESSDADAQEQQRQQELADEAARQLQDEEERQQPGIQDVSPPAVEDDDDVAVTPPDEPEVKPASPPEVASAAADQAPPAEAVDEGAKEAAEGPMPVHEEADSTIYVRELGVPDDRPETPAAEVVEPDDEEDAASTADPETPAAEAKDEAADPGPEEDADDEVVAKEEDEDAAEEVEAAAGEDTHQDPDDDNAADEDTGEQDQAGGDEGEVERMVDEDATNEGATTEGGGDDDTGVTTDSGSEVEKEEGEGGDKVSELSEPARAKLEFLRDKSPEAEEDDDGELVGIAFPPMPDGSPDGTYLASAEIEVQELSAIGELTARINDIAVNQGIQGHGLATQMLETLAAECQARGIENIDGFLVSPAIVGAMTNAFGEEAVRIYHNLYQELPMTPAQAIEVLSSERLEELEEMRNYDEEHIMERSVYVRIHL